MQAPVEQGICISDTKRNHLQKIKIMPIDAKHEDLQSLRIDRTARTGGEGEPPVWARRYILIGIGLLVVLGVVATAYRLLSQDPPQVEVVRASAQSSDVGGVVLSASGYIVAHHKINLNSKVTGRVQWIGVEKGDKVKEGQILVRLEDDEFRAQYEQAKGAAENARAYLEELQNGSRPEEIQQAQHNLDEARATLADDQLTLDRTKDLWSQGVVSKQALGRRHWQVRSRPATCQFSGQGVPVSEARPSQGGNCARTGRSRTGSRAGGLCQVLARRYLDPRAGYGNHSGACRRKRS